MSDDEHDKLDLGAWDAQEPSKDFAEGVLTRVLAERGAAAPPADASTPVIRVPGGASKARTGAFVVGALALAAGIAAYLGRGPADRGEAIAKERAEVQIGARARAVLEPGAHVRFAGDDVEQSHGDVFYRVEPGARFRVHTPAGDVEVQGTCFTVKIRGEAREANEEAMNKRDMKSAAVGAGLSALAFVAVYEGKVAVSHASEHVDLRAGESAQLGPNGARATGAIDDGAKAFDAQAQATGAEGSPLAQANDNLVAQVSEYRSRLELIAAQKIELEQKLKSSEAKLSADGGAVRTRPEYDLSQDDWKELAKNGDVKYRMPCFSPEGWTFSPEKLNDLGLAPQDAPTLRDAYQKSYDRMWAVIRPLCAQALGTTADVVDKIGPSTCLHLVYDVAKNQNASAAQEAHTQSAEIRAGILAEPPGDKQHPVMKMFLAATSANKAFEQDLAKSFGPEEAYRIANADNMCTQKSSWGGGVKRDAKP